MADVPTVALSSGHRIPQLGFGVFKVPSDQTREVVATALETGYRSIDTAAMYGYDAALAAFEHSRSRLGLDYVDLYLIHWPLPSQDRYVDTWRALIALRETGVVRSIGVSNFQPAHLARVSDETGVTPALNQIELHPYLIQEQVREYDLSHGIVTEAWSPIARGGELLTDQVITSLAEKYGKTPAQIVIRWHLELGNVVIPKSVTPARIRENFDVFDIDLDSEDVEAISSLNRNERRGMHPDHVTAP
jgi:2,5-diketo-D-gluconate reductase A